MFHLRELFHLILHFSSLKNQVFDETDRLITRSCDNLISGVAMINVGIINSKLLCE